MPLFQGPPNGVGHRQQRTEEPSQAATAGLRPQKSAICTQPGTCPAGFLVLHGFVTECFIPPEKPKGILAWPSIRLSPMCAAVVCFWSQAILCEYQCKWGTLLWRLLGLVLPLSAGDNQPVYFEERNTRVGIYGGICSPVPLLIQGHPAPLWACNCSEPGFSLLGIQAEFSSSSSPLWARGWRCMDIQKDPSKNKAFGGEKIIK